MKRFELLPIDGRASFGGKCYVEERGTKATLYSYQSKIATYDTATKTLRKYKDWDFGQTTKRHQRAFLAFYGINA